MIKDLLGEEWYEILKEEFNKDYMINLYSFVNNSRENKIIYPKKEDVFNAYKYTPYSKVKVCIIAQDPYIRENQAHGLSFSVENGSYTPSLKQIAKVLFTPDEKGLLVNKDWNNNLIRWTEQGVMLLNRVLTVEEGKSNSHKGKGWEIFTNKTVELLDQKRDIIFLLWGKDAQTVKPFIKHSNIIEAEHPVAASYRGATWNCNDCFNKTNNILKEKIVW